MRQLASVCGPTATATFKQVTNEMLKMPSCHPGVTCGAHAWLVCHVGRCSRRAPSVDWELARGAVTIVYSVLAEQKPGTAGTELVLSAVTQARLHKWVRCAARPGLQAMTTSDIRSHADQRQGITDGRRTLPASSAGWVHVRPEGTLRLQCRSVRPLVQLRHDA